MGCLLMRGDTLRWEGSRDSRHDLELQILGLENVGYTCERVKVKQLKGR